MTLSGQLIFILLLFFIYLLPRVYKNFSLTCVVYMLIIVGDDQYFKKCVSTEIICKRLTISFVISFGVHVIFGILLIVGDIKQKHKLMIPWLLWWCMPLVGIIVAAWNYRYIYLATAGWIATMCCDIFFFKYEKYKNCLIVATEPNNKQGLSSVCSDQPVATEKFRQTDCDVIKICLVPRSQVGSSNTNLVINSKSHHVAQQ